MPGMPGTLYIVATPIGNLEDITARALRILREVDLIACEDTRHTQKLLNHFDIQKKTVSYHEHNEHDRAEELCSSLEEGKNIAVVSDAGTPLINDPGYRIVQLAIERQIRVIPIPGAAAFVAALTASGLPSDQFFFAGFLPPRANARRVRLEELAAVTATLILYEAPHRIAATLRDALDALGDRNAVVARELTKIHEEFARGTLSELIQRFAENNARGEMVLMISGEPEKDAAVEVPAGRARSEELLKRVEELEADGLDAKTALKTAARELGFKRDEAYRLVMLQKNRRRR
jgi:16S rRNA (cytidine1402-2'-O)-methyltransferase